MEHPVLELVLEWIGIPADVRALVKAIYSHATTTMRTAVGVTRSVVWLRGTLQGDPLSCLLFLLYVEPLLRWLKAEIQPEPLVWEATLAAAYMFVDDLQTLLLSRESFEAFSRIMEQWSDWVQRILRTRQRMCLPV